MIQHEAYKAEITSVVEENAAFLRETMRSKRFVISGAAGLIASYLVDVLVEANNQLGLGMEVHAIDKNEGLLNQRFPVEQSGLHRYCLDVNKDELPAVNADYVIHAASNTSPLDYANKPIETIHTNVFGADHMMRFSLKHARRFLLCSSVEMYGRNNGDTNEFHEDYSGYVDANTIRAGYPTAKRLAEALCNAYLKENPSWEFTIARIGRIYGPTVIDGDTKAPSQFIGNAVRGKDIVMKSSGTQQFSYGYVADCTMALLYILAKGENGNAYNIANPESSVTLRDFAEATAKAGGVKLVHGEFSEAEKAGYSKITKATMCMKKLMALGWQPHFSLQDGVARTVRMIKAERG